MVLKAAWLVDTVGVQGARIEISAIKVAVPRIATCDRPLASRCSAVQASVRTFRSPRCMPTPHPQIADGPDEVHKRSAAPRVAAIHG